MVAQFSLFAAERVVPGLFLIPEAIDRRTEEAVAALIDAAPLAPFRFGQWEGKRMTANYGSAYDYQRGKPIAAPPLPEWLRYLRNAITPLCSRGPAEFEQALVIRYDPGAGIGWHRDRPQYGEVIGLSLSSPATLRLRRRLKTGGFERRGVDLPARSIYLLSGDVRDGWEHSIAPLTTTRRSVTFRTMRA